MNEDQSESEKRGREKEKNSLIERKRSTEAT